MMEDLRASSIVSIEQASAAGSAKFPALDCSWSRGNEGTNSLLIEMHFIDFITLLEILELLLFSFLLLALLAFLLLFALLAPLHSFLRSGLFLDYRHA